MQVKGTPPFLYLLSRRVASCFAPGIRQGVFGGLCFCVMHFRCLYHPRLGKKQYGYIKGEK